ncbi:unnamed protein product [Orchesella dallaii]|uniref:G-protein coupled receptors family 1 profile domain-containing protein n=1 Tax=Orchesella dallaii TaxID=48710 RepID=A0ABP1QMA2_9HEXA
MNIMFSSSEMASRHLNLNLSLYSSESYGLESIIENNETYSGNGSLEEARVPHPHVLLPYSALLSIAIYLTFVGILSTFGNILFILTVVRWRYLRNNSHMLLLLNMAVCDLAISVTGYPYTTISGYIGRWIFGDVMCQLYAFLCFTFSQVSMNTLVAVSIFRYIAICRPHMKHLLTSKTSFWALGMVWAHALFWTGAPLVGWSSYTFEPTRISCSFDWNDRTIGGISYVIGTTVFCYISHIWILVWCYKRIYRMVYRVQSKTRLKGRGLEEPYKNDTSATLATTISDSNLGNSQNQQPPGVNLEPDSPSAISRCQSMIVFSFATANLTEMELHVLGMNIAMVVAFIIFWTPYAIISVISAFYDKLSPFWYIFPTIFAKTSCMMNPFLYGLTNSFLRKQLLLVLRGFLGLTTPIEDFEVMRQRQQDGLYYNKEGIFVGKRASGAAAQCPCEGCVESRRQIKLLLEQQKARNAAAAAAASAAEESNGERKIGESEIKKEGECSPNNYDGNTSRSPLMMSMSRSSSVHVHLNELPVGEVKVMGNHSENNTNSIILNVSTLSKELNDGDREESETQSSSFVGVDECDRDDTVFRIDIAVGDDIAANKDGLNEG